MVASWETTPKTESYSLAASYFKIDGKFVYDLLYKKHHRLKVLEDDGKQQDQIVEVTEKIRRRHYGCLERN